jgi:methyl-accepting chemotaxis protein/methyl-accepting chemotaxis protein-1 (serine sensor receptor)
MNRLSLRSRLLLLAAIPMTCLVLVSALSAWAVRSSTMSLQSVEGRVVAIKELKTIAGMYAVNIVDTVHRARDGAQTFEQARASVETARKTIAETWKVYTATVQTVEETQLIEKTRVAMGTADAATQALLKILAAGDRAALTEFAAKALYPAIDPVSAEVNALTTLQIDVSRQVYEAGLATERLLLGATAALFLFASVAGIGAAVWVTHQLMGQLGGEPGVAVELARAIAEGDLSRNVTVKPGDTQSLTAALAVMTASLRSIVSELRVGVDQIAGASAEIATGNQDLSQRTEEQASSLQQTAASMEQMTSAVAQNSGSAREASSLASEASRAAAQGGDVVGRVVSTMGEIASQSRRIADIIGVIDGIAFQTNILALNAAVEAARAGEQGRGFAVVASEVRSLAQRSAAAAKQIADLIGDSVTRIDAGTRQVQDAGAVMKEIVGSIRSVSDYVARISESSVQQEQDIEQLNHAIAELERVTQQNAALVEQASAATLSLESQATQMTQAIALFKTTAHA